MTDAFEILPDEPELDEDVQRLLAEVDRLASGDSVEAAAEPPPETAPHPARIFYVRVDQPLPLLLRAFHDAMGGRTFAGPAYLFSFYRADRSASLLVAFHGFTPPGEMEIVFLADRAAIKRSIFTRVAHIAFNDLALRRLVVRIPAGNEAFRSYARRLGFQPEGIARSFYADGSDASLWAMTPDRCPWLKRGFVPPFEMAPPPGTTVH